jgi:predicted tellurium resistance membrane protein TerC
MHELLSDPGVWIAFATLLSLEIVLGIDNIIFIVIMAGKLPEHQQASARRVGLALAAITRVLLLLSLTWMIRLTAPLFIVFDHEISGRDLILLGGGAFLIAKATHEIHQRLEGPEATKQVGVVTSFTSVVFQIMLLDVVFSLDSVITAIGMVDQVPVMIAAILGAIVVMLVFAGRLAAFVTRHPTVKILALSFLLLIGVNLIAEGFERHIPKGMIYFAMGFSVFVEAINIRVRRHQPVHLHEPYIPAEEKIPT